MSNHGEYPAPQTQPLSLERPRDLRVIKTLALISATAKEMLLAEPLARLTVKELCERAQINKKTFYRYYATMDQLIAELQAEYVEQFVPLVADLRLPEDVRQITQRFWEFSLAQDQLYERITCLTSFTDLHEQMVKAVNTKLEANLQAPPTCSSSTWQLYLDFTFQSTLSMYRAWVEHGKALPVEEVIDLCCQTVAGGTLGFFGKLSPQEFVKLTQL